ncbi:MAG TPA: stage III sporulation protein AC [Peptococcaceae bacterium]|nr:stage III sporulation protein AC [Peptococcaceae bacterium]
MDFSLLIKVAGIGILVGILVAILNAIDKKEQAQLVTLAGVVVVLYIVVQGIADLFALVKEVFNLY